MAFFNKLSNTISAAGKDGLSKAKEIKDTAKISVDIKEREGAIQRMYVELGKAYYRDHKCDSAPEYDQILAIKAAFEEIQELKASKDDIRGIRRCPSCGAVISQEAKFCASCGVKCEEVVTGEVVDDPEEETCDSCDSEDTAEDVCEEEPVCDACAEEVSDEDVPAAEEAACEAAEDAAEPACEACGEAENSAEESCCEEAPAEEPGCGCCSDEE